ncbi:MAG: radical SAM protein [Candidatus Thorarchaeota archaeon]
MIRYEGSIWRPPSEARSLILQATIGCSHNACIFCVSYKQKKYRVRGVKGIQDDLDGLSPHYKNTVRRVFLADGNALAMPTQELVDTLILLKKEIPNLERVGVYGYAKDVREKTIEDLQELNKAGLGIIYLGLETGVDELLRWACKRISSDENIDACKKIRAAGIPLSLTIILGLGGLEHSEKHARKTAEVLNKIDPEYIGALTLMTPLGTRIYDMMTAGEFVPMKPMEILRELRLLVENLDITNCVFRTNHASNYLALGGNLPGDKARILSVLESAIMSGDESVLRPSYTRGL